ncbi:hypothetical protein T4E_4984, partial [Trichinella pseudospiralis]
LVTGPRPSVRPSVRSFGLHASCLFRRHHYSVVVLLLLLALV